MELTSTVADTAIPVTIVPGAISIVELSSTMAPTKLISITFIRSSAHLQVHLQEHLSGICEVSQLIKISVNRIIELSSFGLKHLPLVSHVSILGNEHAKQELLELLGWLQRKLEVVDFPAEPLAGILWLLPPIIEALNVLEVKWILRRQLTVEHHL